MTQKSDLVNIIKFNAHHEEVWRYSGRILAQGKNKLLVEAFFNIDDISFYGITIRRDDRAIECYYSDRWYNIFEIHDQDDDQLKGWYCNITKPAEFNPGQITYVDLALDALVYPDGTYRILDEEEFKALDLEPFIRESALEALKKLRAIIESGKLAKILRY